MAETAQVNTAEAASSAAPSAAATLDAEMTKYKSAADIVHNVLKQLVDAAVEGANIHQLCIAGDEALEKGTGAVFNNKVKGVKVTKGIAFPTCISVNNAVSHFSPLPSDPLADATLKNGDVVKIQLGAHIDGYAAVQTETLVVGATAENPATGRQADVVKAAWHAAEIAMRHVKVGNKNWAVTEAVAKTVAEWNCKPVEGMLSCQHTKNAIDGKKRIILNPTTEQRSGHETITFAEGEVYGIDILVSSGEDGKARQEESRTSVYQRVGDVTYQLKMKTSRAVFSDVQKKAGSFPFTLRVLEEEKRARMGVQEAVVHGLLRPYDVVYTPPGTLVAAFMFTIALLPAGPSLITHPPVWYKPEKVKSDKELQDEELKELVTKPLRESKKKNKKKAGEAEAAN
ncbi:Curved DNA-binding protein (42 kDa protein) [Tulasnella sp. 419]|nr:Curved DNA-binding protein (42 kDa protein) [Tulasnella sp. 419]